MEFIHSVFIDYPVHKKGPIALARQILEIISTLIWLRGRANAPYGHFLFQPG